MLDWIKKHKVLVGIIILVIIFGIPLLIHCLFKIYVNDFWMAKWGAGDVLQFYGSILAFIGTVTLGILSLHQNQVIKEETDKRVEMQETREREMNKPIFRVKFLHSSGCNGKIELQIENITYNDAFEIFFFPLQIINAEKKRLWEEKSAIHHDAIMGKEVFTLKLSNSELKEDKVSIEIGMKCKDKYGYERKYSIYAFCDTRSTMPNFFIKEILE